MTGWESVRLSALLREIDDRGHPDSEVLSVYRDLGVVPKASREDNFNKTPDNLSSYKRVRVGDLVVNKMKAWSGSLAVSDYDGIVSGDYMVCAVVGAVDRRFLHHLLRSKPVFSQIAALSTGIRPSQWRLYWDDLRQVRLRVPELRMQHAIADYLDAESARLDAIVHSRREQIRLLAARQDALIWHAVTKGIRPAVLRAAGVGWVGEVPGHWGTPSIGAHFDVQLGKMLNPDARTSGEVSRYLRNLNIQWDRFDLDDLDAMHFDASDRQRYALRPGDLMVCEGGVVGRCAIWRGELDGVYYQKALHRVRPRKDGLVRFLMYCLWAAAFRGTFEIEGNTSTIVHLTAEKLRAHRVPWPPVVEQSEIVDFLDRKRSSMDELRRPYERQIDLLLERRQALIAAAVTGELQIPGVAA